MYVKNDAKRCNSEVFLERLGSFWEASYPPRTRDSANSAQERPSELYAAGTPAELHQMFMQTGHLELRAMAEAMSYKCMQILRLLLNSCLGDLDCSLTPLLSA